MDKREELIQLLIDHPELQEEFVERALKTVTGRERQIIQVVLEHPEHVDFYEQIASGLEGGEMT